MSDKEKKMTAYHEVGHALIGHLLPGCDPIHKVSIISRGSAGGVTWSRPEEEKNYLSQSNFEDDLCMALGGYVAEETFFGEISTGPSSDLQQVAKRAKAMITRFGMSDLGPIAFVGGNDEVFLGKDFGHVKGYSEASAAEIDKRISLVINKAYKRAQALVKKHKSLMIKISEDLIKKENMNGKELAAYFTNTPVPKKAKK